MTLGIALLLCQQSPAQESLDPAFDPPFRTSDAGGRRIRWNGTIGMVIINGKLYQQFGLRPDVPLGKWGVGLDLTLRVDEEGNLKEDEWDEPEDAIEKIYYIRYGAPGDPLYLRVGALDNVTIGYGIIMHRYANTIQYPEIKRVGAYVEGEYGKGGLLSFQGMTNNFREFDQPGVVAGRLAIRPPIKFSPVFGATIGMDGNQYAGLQDSDNDGVPNRLDLFGDIDDRQRVQDIENLLTPEEIAQLIEWGNLPDIYRIKRLGDYRDRTDEVVLTGIDAGIPVAKAKNFSLWGYAQAAQAHDYGWGWAFPGARSVIGPVEIGLEYRRYEKEFIGDYFDYSYELERAQVVGDSTYQTKESGLNGLGKAEGIYGDLTLSLTDIGYVYAWALDMHGPNYPSGKTFYGEAAATPPQNLSRLRKIAGYFYQPNKPEFFEKLSDGTIYGGKFFVALAPNVNLVYDHRVTYANGETYRTVRIETMVSF
ncbi:MAG: hypothetical protein H6508_04125 [Calditrichaeota bacterium]|nr:hypothetical protein [Calditrichota bacterium]MCB9366355.1 hypothetical protein [Calditrichota bacterium]